MNARSIWPSLVILTLVLGSPAAFSGPASARPEDPIAGVWQGTIQSRVGPLEVYFIIEAWTGGAYLGKMTIPRQKVREMPLQKVSFVPPDIVLDMASFGIVFEGRLATDMGSITGKIVIGGDTMDLALRRAAALPDMAKAQEPRKPYPYEENEVRFINRETSLHLSGTLTLPPGPGPFPAVILVSGSGPQDRDSTIAGHRPFLVWADALTRRGFAVLRCDDRGTGKSEGDFHAATTLDFASDAGAAREFLKGDSRVDPRRIGFLGHSEGAIIAPIAAVRNPETAFLVLLAGTAIPGDRLALMQTEAVSRSRGAGPEAVQKEARMYREMFGVFETSGSARDAEAELEKIIAASVAGMSDAERKELDLSADSLRADVKGMLADYPWNRFFLGYDPATTLRKVRCPVLALNGDKDTQVPADVNLAAIGKALDEAGNKKFEVRKIPGLNHLFQKAQTGHPKEYRDIEETVSPEVLKLVGDWILRIVS